MLRKFLKHIGFETSLFSLAQLEKKCNFATKYPKELICVAAKFRISSLFALSNTSKD